MNSRLSLVLVTMALAGAPESSLAKDAEPPRVTIETGTIEGTWAGEESRIAAFKGIPFAAPPVGERRWKPPEAAVAWKGVREAVEFSSVCPQPRVDEFLGWLSTTLGGDPTQAPPIGAADEDCLYLNVWTPDLRGTAKLPVMVWLHGGSFLLGTGSTSWYDGRSLAQNGAVVVTLNYRLGTLGFLAHPELTKESPHRASGNYGLLDQLAALEWVKRNIRAFGGDPGRVTIFGESSGGTAVVFLMTSPAATGLFHRAIAQSFGESYVYPGSPELDAIAGKGNLRAAEQIGLELVGRLGLEEADRSLVRLREVPAEDLVEASKNEQLVNFYVPNVDGWVLPEAPATVFREGRQHPVPLMTGVTADEGSVVLADPPFESVDEYEGFVKERFGSDAETLLTLFPTTSPEEIRAARLRWYQTGILANHRYLATTMAKVDRPAFLYVFSRVPPGPGGELFGAWHFSEVQFVFDTHFPEAFPLGPGDEALTELMGRIWVRFAATGDPNGEGLPLWSPYTRSAERCLDLNHESGEKSLSTEEIRELDVMEALIWR